MADHSNEALQFQNPYNDFYAREDDLYARDDLLGVDQLELEDHVQWVGFWIIIGSLQQRYSLPRAVYDSPSLMGL
jgi:hypothetical protein